MYVVKDKYKNYKNPGFRQKENQNYENNSFKIFQVYNVRYIINTFIYFLCCKRGGVKPPKLPCFMPWAHSSSTMSIGNLNKL